MEKIIGKIRKLLEMTQENGASENEAVVAALKAQKLMAEYNLNIADIETKDESSAIVEESFACGNGDKWKYGLANIIATNFRCKTYFIGKLHVVFYGYESDAKIALDVFKFLFNTGNKLADKCYYEYYKKGENTRGVKNSFLIGFCEGIKDVLGKQCVALMIVTPKEVEESWKEKSSSMKSIPNRLRANNDKRAFEKGRQEGRNTANARSIEG
jgi:hypothetical protein